MANIYDNFTVYLRQRLAKGHVLAPATVREEALITEI